MVVDDAQTHFRQGRIARELPAMYGTSKTAAGGSGPKGSDGSGMSRVGGSDLMEFARRVAVRERDESVTWIFGGDASPRVMLLEPGVMPYRGETFGLSRSDIKAFVQYVIGREFGPAAVAQWNEDRRDQSMLSRDDRVAHAVGQHKPGREGREAQLPVAARITTKCFRLLHVVVDTTHRAIIGARIEDLGEWKARLSASINRR